MKNNSSNLILVEGENDKVLFSRICAKYKINTRIKVGTPLDLTGNVVGAFNSKQGVINALDTILKMLEDESALIQKLAIIVDSDYNDSNKGGVRNTLEQIKIISNDHGYSKIHKFNKDNNGIIIPHNDENMNPLYIWVMPNNKDDGTVEDWIKSKILPSENELFSHACSIVSQLKNKKFTDNSVVKAEIATWLAWQNQPGRTVSYALKDGYELIDIENSDFVNFINWLKEFSK